MAPNPEILTRSSDELRTERIVDFAAQQGIYVEVGTHIDASTGEKTYFAMSLPHFIHITALEHVLGDYIRRHQEEHAAPANPGLYPIMPLTRLPQAEFEAQETYVSGYADSQSALLASRDVLFERLGYTYELPPEEPAS